jgi:hypothetical protein
VRADCEGAVGVRLENEALPFGGGVGLDVDDGVAAGVRADDGAMVRAQIDGAAEEVLEAEVRGGAVLLVVLLLLLRRTPLLLRRATRLLRRITTLLRRIATRIPLLLGRITTLLRRITALRRIATLLRRIPLLLGRITTLLRRVALRITTLLGRIAGLLWVTLWLHFRSAGECGGSTSTERQLGSLGVQCIQSTNVCAAAKACEMGGRFCRRTACCAGCGHRKCAGRDAASREKPTGSHECIAR